MVWGIIREEPAQEKDMKNIPRRLAYIGSKGLPDIGAYVREEIMVHGVKHYDMHHKQAQQRQKNELYRFAADRQVVPQSIAVIKTEQQHIPGREIKYLERVSGAKIDEAGAERILAAGITQVFLSEQQRDQDKQQPL